MNDIYKKNFGIWLGIPLLVTTLLPLIGVYNEILSIFALIAGTILAIIMTHKDNGGPIKFEKTILPLLLVNSIVSVFSIIIMMMLWGGFGNIIWLIISIITAIIFKSFISLMIIMFAGTWYMYEKANQPGWACIVPIYNILVLLDIAKKPRWWIFMFFVPIANIVFIVMTYNQVSKNFGKDEGFTVGLVLLNQVFFAILGYGSATYLEGENQQNRTENPDLLDF